MGKKRKASGPSQPKGPREYDPKDGKLGPINSYEDIADEQEKYFLDRDQILFDDDRQSKKQRRQQEEEDFLENSDEEVFDYDDQDSEEEDDDEEAYARQQKPKSGKKNVDDSESEAGGDEGDEGESGWWGSSKREYYDNDQIETEADALEEEKEALRLQKKKLANMSEEAFMFDENEWAAPDADKDGDEEDEEVITEVLKDVEIPDDMPADERYRLLQRLYPEIDPLAEQLLELQPLLVELQKQAQGQPPRSVPVIKYRVLGCHVATLAMYFATLTSPVRDVDGETKTLDPADLRDHEVMNTLLECREAWKKVENLKTVDQAQAEDSMLTPPEDEEMEDVEIEAEEAPKLSKKEAAKRKAEKKAAKKAKQIEASIADLDSLLATNAKKSKQKVSRTESPEDDDSDFGEEETLDARAAAEKAARKKSLRFYTSQIVQKAKKRADAGRDAGGDEDLPYRERFRDRQARLNAQAEKRGQMGSKHGDGGELGGESSGEDETANKMREDEGEYYDMVAQRSKAKKNQKAVAKAAANQKELILDDEALGEDGRRQINRAIEKNKGLTPKRKKEVRNPRVKKKRKYEEKKRKIGSQKAVYKGGEGKGGYQGELTGIKPGLVKSRKL